MSIPAKLLIYQHVKVLNVLVSAQENVICMHVMKNIDVMICLFVVAIFTVFSMLTYHCNLHGKVLKEWKVGFRLTIQWKN